MAASLREAGFEIYNADPDVWMKAEVKPTGERSTGHSSFAM